jgi:hypothetical protein
MGADTVLACSFLLPGEPEFTKGSMTSQEGRCQPVDKRPLSLFFLDISIRSAIKFGILSQEKEKEGL